jgi:tRNA threonylcarbamoyladenosine biosynthesis protein TsaB
MLILAFDTTSPRGGAALYDDGEPLAQVQAEGTGSYSIALFEMVDRLLLEAGAHLPEVELFAAATGPGSFTGIRVGLAAAQGWAKALGRPVCGVSVLEAMVEAARPRGRTVLPVLDARRGEFYLGVFRRGATPGKIGAPEEEFSLSGEGRVLDAARIAALLDELARDGGSGVTLIAGEHDQAALELSRRLPAPLERMTAPAFLAGPIARVALRAARAGRLQRPEELTAWYIRRSDAELHWRE